MRDRKILDWIISYRVLSGVVFCLGITLALFFAAHLLYSSFCAMTWGKFAYKDYGVYTNMIWNSGHGRLFSCGLTDNYLYTHLAFTLALLGPFFRLWNNPFLLSLMQWCMLIVGACILSVAGKKRGFAKEEIAALVFFFIGYRFTQSVILSEFHTVSVYFLLVPALYYCLAFNKKLVWLPLSLILGVREDAFIFILPMFLYFAIKDKWWAGYVYMAIAILYGLLALFVIYPALNDNLSIVARRSNYLDPGRWHFSEPDAIVRRLHAVILTCLPVLCFSLRRFYVPLIFSIAGLAVAIFSSWPAQQALGGIYSATVIVCLVPGLLEANTAYSEHAVKTSRNKRLIGSVLLIILTLLVHFYSGFIVGGGKNHYVYQSPKISGIFALRAAGHLPAHGALLTEQNLMGFCSNRARIVSTDNYDDVGTGMDLFFMHIDALRQKLDGQLIARIEADELGVYYYDAEYVILKKGYDTSLNSKFMVTHIRRPITVVLTPKHGGKDLLIGKHAFRRYWCGDGHKAPVTLSYGEFRWLPAGKYLAVFSYAVAPPKKECCGNWGVFSLHYLNNQGESLAEAVIQPVEGRGDMLEEQVLGFDLEKDSNVEIRITGGDAELWLYKVIFLPVAP